MTDTVAPHYPMARAPGCPLDPPPQLRAMDRLSKVRLWDGSTAWLVPRYADQRALLADPRISADPCRDGYPHVSPAGKVRRRRLRAFISMDEPEHSRMRRMVTAAFAIRRVEQLRPVVQEIVDELIDDLLAGPRPADLVQAFALPVPSTVICRLLGVPYADHDRFQGYSRTMLRRDAPAEEAIGAQEALVAYLEGVIEDKLSEPADDMLSRLATEQVATGELTRREAASMGVLLLVAGHETTANMIALGTIALLQHPDQLAVLRDADDPAVVAGAVEELLRYLTIAHSGRRRVALEDIQLDGHVIRAGEGVILPNEAGNRDVEPFPDPDRLDIHRDARGHVAFGFGVHQCLGQPLARVELQVVYGTLYRRIPGLRLAVPIEEIPFKYDSLVFGAYELPVSW
jgi:cytochrome P450